MDKNDRQKVTVNMSMSVRAKERMERLSDLTDASSSSEVVRQALHVYEIMVEKRLAGERFFFETQKGELSLFDMLIDVPTNR